MNSNRGKGKQHRFLPLLIIAGVFAAAWIGGTDSYAHKAPEKETVRIIVKSSPNAEYQSAKEWRDSKLIRAVMEGVPGEQIPPATLLDTELHFVAKQNKVQFAVTPDGDVVDDRGMVLGIDKESKEKLKKTVAEIRTKHYGEYIPWLQADLEMPKYSSFAIVDLETGLRFQGQRRAGSQHADVQPLTKEDTNIMKTIYQGSWSWNRRAVLVKVNGRTFAASMHGMPHGGDGIPGNGFNGHFCIHFLGSVTHGSRSLDLMHQAMVHKAAGRLSYFLAQQSPFELVDIWISGNHQHDAQLLWGTTGSNQDDPDRFAGMRRLSDFPVADPGRLLAIDIPVRVSVTESGGKLSSMNLVFHVERSSEKSRWVISHVSFT